MSRARPYVCECRNYKYVSIYVAINTGASNISKIENTRDSPHIV